MGFEAYRPRMIHECTNWLMDVFEYSWSYSWMVFIMRSFAMFDQVKVGGAEEDFHGVGSLWSVSARG